MSKPMVVEAAARSKVMILFIHYLLLLPLRVVYFCVGFLFGGVIMDVLYNLASILVRKRADGLTLFVL